MVITRFEGKLVPTLSSNKKLIPEETYPLEEIKYSTIYSV